MESSPPAEGPYPQLEDSWSRGAPEDCRDLVQLAPLPVLSLQEVLGELDEDWLEEELLRRERHSADDEDEDEDEAFVCAGLRF